jgi:hypothetical protein
MRLGYSEENLKIYLIKEQKYSEEEVLRAFTTAENLLAMESTVKNNKKLTTRQIILAAIIIIVIGLLLFFGPGLIESMSENTNNDFNTLLDGTLGDLVDNPDVDSNNNQVNNI